METFSAFPAQRPVTRSFDVFFHLHLNKRLSKQPRGWWFETPPWSLWRQCNVITCYLYIITAGLELLIGGLHIITAGHELLTGCLRIITGGLQLLCCVHQLLTGVLHIITANISKTSKHGIIGPLSGNPLYTGGSPHKGPVVPKAFPCHDAVIMKC